jgi:hypothetical protein
MTLERGQRIKFPQTAQGAIVAGLLRTIRTAVILAAKTGAHFLDRAPATAARAQARIETNNNLGGGFGPMSKMSRRANVGCNCAHGIA